MFFKHFIIFWIGACLPFLRVFSLCSAGETVPSEEQYDKEKVNAEVLALDNTINNDKFASTPSMPPMPGMLGARLTGVEKDKCEVELAKLYKQLDDKVHTHTNHFH